jgi:hypothetical protein
MPCTSPKAEFFKPPVGTREPYRNEGGSDWERGERGEAGLLPKWDKEFCASCQDVVAEAIAIAIAGVWQSRRVLSMTICYPHVPWKFAGGKRAGEGAV